MIKYKHMILISALMFSCSEPTNGVDGLNGEDGVEDEKPTILCLRAVNGACL